MTGGGPGTRPLRTLSPSDRHFARRALGRRRLFLALSVAGIAAGLGLAALYGYRRLIDPGYPLGLPAVVILLVLLNARQNLRQYRYVRVLESFSATILGTDERNPSTPRGLGGA